MTRVLGLDLALGVTGIALPSGQLCRIITNDRAGDRRLNHIEDAITYYAGSTTPDVAVIEKIPTATRGFETAVSLALVHGVTRSALARHGVPFAYIPGTTLKKYATGSGGASKQDMIDRAYDIFGREPQDDNEADAAWLRLAGIHRYDRVPPSVEHALSLELISGPRCKVKWPDLAARAAHPVQRGR